ncbi:MAG: PQQ-like beta-propeller repeat protein [Verrucomicrobiae bacterium]|nr:PQQ-like beta-propeller repeat protein [Verrucomicrobiae bacterium]
MNLSGMTLGSLVCLIFLPEANAEWNQWRGPQRTGIISDDSAWPLSLGDGSLVKQWSAPLAEGYSSPISDGERLFTFSTKEETREVVKAFDLVSGKLLWERSWEGSIKVPFFAKKNGSWVRSTPAVHNGALYVAGMRDVLVKLDASSGDEIWRVDFTQREETEPPAFGYVSSPLVDGDAVYVQAGLAVSKLDATTGETLWRSMEDERPMFGSAFSSPVMATVAGKRQLLVQARLELAGLDPDSGKVLWSTPVKAFRGMNILTPTVIGDDRVFTASYGGGAFLFSIAPGEGGSFAVKQEWNNESIEGYMSSPVVIEGHVYLHGKDKKLHCLSLADGSVAWTSEEEFGEYWSMICRENLILALDQTGALLLVRASPEKLDIVDRRTVSEREPTWAHLGIEGETLLVRSLKDMSVWRWRE